MGIYLFKRDVLLGLLLNDLKDAKDFGKEIIPHSIQGHQVYSYQYDGYWTDIGNIPSFFEANIGLTKDIPEFNFFDNENKVYSRARMLPPAKINGTFLKNTLAADGCIIYAERMENCLIGIRMRIGFGTVVQDTYMMGSDFYETLEDIARQASKGIPKMGIGDNCFIRNAIIDKNCRIGNNVRINGGTHLADTDQSLYVVKEGIVVVKKGAIVPDGFSLG